VMEKIKLITTMILNQSYHTLVLVNAIKLKVNTFVTTNQF
jgi:hypothetical protein